MNSKSVNFKLFGFTFMEFSPLQYIVLTAIAMFFYTGGNLIDPSSPGYSFWTNFFSDLGRTVSLSGKPNLISFTIFMITALILGISFTFYICLFPSLFKQNKKSRTIAVIGSLIGFIFCIGLFGTILTPWDLLYKEHLLFANIFNISGLLVLVFYSIAILLEKNYPNKFAIALILLLIIGITYSIILINLPKNLNLQTLTIQATSQKFSQYFFLICFSFQGFGAKKQAQKIQPVVINLKNDKLKTITREIN